MQLFANNIETTLANALSSAAVSLTVTDATGMPEPSGSDYFLLTLCKRANDIETDIEIVKCTARSGAVLTIARAQEGTTAGTYAVGDIAGMRLTKGALEDGFPPDLAIGRINNPLLHLPLKNSLDMICGAGSVTFTRSTTATYIDRYGVVQDAAVNEARFEKEGLLIEGASTNKCLQSEDFSTTWATTRSSISTDAVGAPDGTITADKLVEDSTAASTHYVQQAITVAAGDFTGSIFVKKGTRTKCRLSIYNGTDGLQGASNFDLAAGTVISGSGSIEELADDWFRCSITGTVTVTTNYLQIIMINDSGSASYDGDGSSYLYLWGAQLEEMSFASSYIPTTTAAVTRAADKCEVTYANNIPAINTEPMTILADFDVLGFVPSITNTLYRCDTYRWLRVQEPSHVIESHYGPSGNMATSTTVISANTSYRGGQVVDSSYLKCFLDGVEEASMAVGTISGTIADVNIGYSGSGEYLYGHISNFRIYDVALTEAEMRIA